MTDEIDLKLKESVFAFCCEFASAKKNDIIRFSECKENFKTVHPNKLDDIFEALSKDGKIQVEPGRIVMYKIDSVELNKFQVLKNLVDNKLNSTANTYTTSKTTNGENKKRKCDNVCEHPNSNLVDNNVAHAKSIHKFTDILENCENRVPNGNILQVWKSPKNSIVDICATTVPTNTNACSLSPADVDLLLQVLDRAFSGSDGGTVQVSAVKERIGSTDCGKVLLGALQEGLAYLERQNKIMLDGEDIFSYCVTMYIAADTRAARHRRIGCTGGWSVAENLNNCQTIVA